MAQYPLTEAQKQFLTELAEKFKQGMGSQMTLKRGNDTILGAFVFGGNEQITPPELNDDDLPDYVRLGLMRVLKYDRAGLPERISFHKQLVIDAVDNRFEIHPSQRQGVDARSINIGTNYGNAGIDSHFENIVQTVNVGSALQDNLRDQLIVLLNELGEELSQLPEQSANDKEVIEVYTEDVAKELTAETPNPRRLKLRVDNLVKAAEIVSKIAPNIVETAVKISVLLAPILGDAV